MKITWNNEAVTITMNSEKDAIRLIKMYDYARYINLTTGIKDVSDKQILEVADEVNKAWFEGRTKTK